MRDITRRLDKAEKQLRMDEPHLVNIAGIEMMSDEFEKLLKEIDGKSRGLPCKEEVSEHQALYAERTEQ